MTKRRGSRYSFVRGPPHQGSVVVSIDCGQPQCGVQSNTFQTVSSLNEPLPNLSDSASEEMKGKSTDEAEEKYTDQV